MQKKLFFLQIHLSGIALYDIRGPSYLESTTLQQQTAQITVQLPMRSLSSTEPRQQRCVI